MKRIYIYGMKERGFSPGCQPKDGFGGHIKSHDPRYYDILYYERKLTDKEVNDYELEYLGKWSIQVE